jgi:hypothetical protein
MRSLDRRDPPGCRYSGQHGSADTTRAEDCEWKDAIKTYHS